MIRNHDFVPGKFYHIYNRGNSKQNIFLDDSDRDRFIKLLYLHNSHKNINFKEDIVQKKINAWEFDRGESLVAVGAWVLMPNHFHIYLSPMSDIGEVGVTSFMRKLCTSYSKYFNTKHNRTGGLFEGNFKSQHVDFDQYAKYIFSYIHLNPIKIFNPLWKKEGIKNYDEALAFLDSYKWSSYADYREKARPESAILCKEKFPEYFQNKEVFNKEIFDWLSYKDTDVGHR